MGNEYRTPTQTTAPVVNTTAGLWTFTPPASCIVLTNFSGQTINVRFNTATGATAAGGGHDLLMLNNTVLRVSAAEYGLQNIDRVSVWFPTSATVADFSIRGN